MNRLIMERPDGTRYTIAPGENHPAADRVLDIERNGVSLSEEEIAAREMLAEIERDLGEEAGQAGDWVKFFAEPVALMLGKTDCAACEFRRVCLNAGKKLRAKFGPAEGKKKMKALIKRSFTEKPDRLARELKELLET
jgi:hypothetical protein